MTFGRASVGKGLRTLDSASCKLVYCLDALPSPVFTTSMQWIPIFQTLWTSRMNPGPTLKNGWAILEHTGGAKQVQARIIDSQPLVPNALQRSALMWLVSC